MNNIYFWNIIKIVLIDLFLMDFFPFYSIFIVNLFPDSFKKLIESPDARDVKSTCAEKFIKYFETNYGEKHPEFYRGTYKQVNIKTKQNKTKQNKIKIYNYSISNMSNI